MTILTNTLVLLNLEEKLSIINHKFVGACYKILLLFIPELSSAHRLINRFKALDLLLIKSRVLSFET